MVVKRLDWTLEPFLIREARGLVPDPEPLSLGIRYPTQSLGVRKRGSLVVSTLASGARGLRFDPAPGKEYFGV